MKKLFIILLLMMAIASCDDSEPYNPPPSGRLAIPAVQSPAEGTIVVHNPPPLIVKNVDKPAGVEVLYDFELYNSTSPDPIEAVTGIIEASDGLTRWDPATILTRANDYFWRIRAVGKDGSESPWSEKTKFYLFDIKGNLEHRYIAYGDSITGGYGSSTFGTILPGYLYYLQASLTDIFGMTEISTYWLPGGYSIDGVDNIADALTYVPGTLLILLGSHDIMIGRLPTDEILENLNAIVDAALMNGTLPILATIPPSNPASFLWIYQDAIGEVNTAIREYAAQKGIPLADINTYFWEAADWQVSTLATFYFDHEHPNDTGYEIMAEAWYDTIVGINK
jgi:lysophospholipase L1-like esterase